MNKSRRLFFLFSILCFFGASIFAVNFEENFLKANDFYNNKKYKEALELYRSIDNKGPVIFYNIGNCEFVQGKYLEAIIYWNKAKKNASFELLDNINYNINLAENKLAQAGIKSGAQVGHAVNKQDLGISNYWYKFVDIVNLFYLFNLQIIFLLFWFLFFICYIYLKKLRFLVLIINICLIIFSGICVFVKYDLEKHPLAISKSYGDVFYGPNEKYHKLLSIALAEKVRIIKTDKNWSKIRCNGATGWILSSNLEII